MSRSKQSPTWHSTWWHSTWAKRVLVVGLCVVFAGCTVSPQKSASTNPSSGPRTTAPSSTSASAPPDSGSYHPKRNDLALFAMSLLDTPYAKGGRGPATGFDCSGLVSHVYQQAANLPIKGSAADLGQNAKPIDRTQLQPGDLVFFNTLGPRHSHVGIYVGGGRFVHASNPRTGVRMDLLSNRYYAQRFEGAGTLLD